jgi:hypothetical protein
MFISTNISANDMNGEQGLHVVGLQCLLMRLVFIEFQGFFFISIHLLEGFLTLQFIITLSFDINNKISI